MSERVGARVTAVRGCVCALCLRRSLVDKARALLGPLPSCAGARARSRSRHPPAAAVVSCATTVVPPTASTDAGSWPCSCAIVRMLSTSRCADSASFTAHSCWISIAPPPGGATTRQPGTCWRRRSRVESSPPPRRPPPPPHPPPPPLAPPPPPPRPPPRRASRAPAGAGARGSSRRGGRAASRRTRARRGR